MVDPGRVSGGVRSGGADGEWSGLDLTLTVLVPPAETLTRPRLLPLACPLSRELHIIIRLLPQESGAFLTSLPFQNT